MTVADELATYTGPKDLLARFLAGEQVDRREAAFDSSEWVEVKVTTAQRDELLEMLDLPR